MRIRFTMGDARQVKDRYPCYLLGVLVAEVDEHLKSLWRRASEGDRHNMHIYSLHALNAARDIASRYGSSGGHPAPEVSGPAHYIVRIMEELYDEHRAKRGDLDDAEVEAIRDDVRRASRLSEDMARAAAEACGA